MAAATPFKMRETATHVYFLTGPASMWYPCAFEQQLMPDGPLLKFNCGEQGMMAQKAFHFGDAAALDRIMKVQPEDMQTVLARLKAAPAQTLAAFNEIPHQQKALGRDVKPFDAAEWDRVCQDYVFAVNLAKFSQDHDLRAWLLGTGNKILVEGSKKDRIWGVGLDYSDDRILDVANWQGKNYLGKVLMRVRDWLVRHADLYDLLTQDGIAA